MRKHYLIFLVILIVSNTLFRIGGVAQSFTSEQQQEIKKLTAIINNENSHDTSLASAYLGLSDILYVSNMDTIIPLCNKSRDIAEEALIGDNVSDAIKASLLKSISGSLNNTGYFYMVKGDIKNALRYYEDALKIQEKMDDHKGLALSLNNIGQIYNNLGDISKALEYYDRSLEIQKEIGDQKGLATSLNNIGLVYKNQGDIENALNYYRQSLKIRKEIRDKKGITSSLNNIGVAYSDNGEYKKALNYFEKCLVLNEEIGDVKSMGYNLNNIGNIYIKLGDVENTFNYHSRSLEMREKAGDKLGITQSLINLGKTHFKVHNYVESKSHALRALKMAQELQYPYYIRESAMILSRIYESENNGLQALEMFQLSIAMRDSIKNEETQNASVKRQAKYEYEKQKSIDDAEHEKQIAIEQEAKKKQQVVTYSIGVGLGLVCIFLVFVFNRLQVTKKQKIVIETQKVEVEKQKQVVELAHHELEEKNKEILDSIAYAKRIQSAILPPAKVVKEYLKESFILYKPKDIVAGDFYWLEHKDGKILFAAADCTGHGVPGAMVSVVCNNGLNRSVREYGLTDPGKILDKTREIVVEEFEKSDEEVKDGMDIALCSLSVSSSDSSSDGWYRELKYAGAHNPLWIIRPKRHFALDAESPGDEEIVGQTSNDDYVIIEIKANKQPIGKFDDPIPYTTHTIELEKNDTIYVFSDGYVDQFGGEKGKKFKAKAFRSLLLSIQDQSMEQQRITMDETFESWRGNLEQIDDICIIGVRI